MTSILQLSAMPWLVSYDPRTRMPIRISPTVEQTPPLGGTRVYEEPVLRLGRSSCLPIKLRVTGFVQLVAVVHGVDVGELGAEIEDLRGVVDPDDQHNE